MRPSTTDSTTPPGLPRRRRIVIPALILVVLLCVLGIAAVKYLGPVHALADAVSLDTVHSPPEPVGTQVSFAIPELVVRGQRLVQLVSGRLVEVPPGVQAVSIMAAHYDATGGYVAVTDDGPSRSALPVPKLSPVSAVRIVPRQKTDWYLVATVKVTQPGQFLIKGVAVTYRVDGRTGTQTYPNELRIEAH